VDPQPRRFLKNRNVVNAPFHNFLNKNPLLVQASQPFLKNHLLPETRMTDFFTNIEVVDHQILYFSKYLHLLQHQYKS